ncbi:hypothetical protein TrRE_jg10106 [Triparma retinervis]|uniref:Uncharacterized protein n=1 Tax=Triparma retinervis TaxID=2557542 RepID=A0A9W7CGQ2_9STRA|nr:hypothetical protein TrRE_jg10106 [Triparma retinervis]
MPGTKIADSSTSVSEARAAFRRQSLDEGIPLLNSSEEHQQISLKPLSRVWRTNLDDIASGFVNLVKSSEGNLDNDVEEFCEDVLPDDETGALARELLVSLAPEIQPSLKLARLGLGVRILMSIVLTIMSAAFMMTDNSMMYERNEMSSQKRGPYSHPLTGFIPRGRLRNFAVSFGMFLFYSGYLTCTLVAMSAALTSMCMTFFPLFAVTEFIIYVGALARRGQLRARIFLFCHKSYLDKERVKEWLLSLESSGSLLGGLDKKLPKGCGEFTGHSLDSFFSKSLDRYARLNGSLLTEEYVRVKEHLEGLRKDVAGREGAEKLEREGALVLVGKVQGEGGGEEGEKGEDGTMKERVSHDKAQGEGCGEEGKGEEDEGENRATAEDKEAKIEMLVEALKKRDMKIEGYKILFEHNREAVRKVREENKSLRTQLGEISDLSDDQSFSFSS